MSPQKMLDKCNTFPLILTDLVYISEISDIRCPSCPLPPSRPIKEEYSQYFLIEFSLIFSLHFVPASHPAIALRRKHF